MNEPLQHAWEARPEADQETEDQMLEIMALGQKPDRELCEIIAQQDKEME
jgi:hypothetical protein